MSYNGGYNQYGYYSNPHGLPEGYYGPQFDQWGRPIPPPNSSFLPSPGAFEANNLNPLIPPIFQPPYYHPPPMNYQHHAQMHFPPPTNAIGYCPGGNANRGPAHNHLLPPIQRYASNYQSQRYNRRDRGGSGILDFYIQKKIDEFVEKEKNSRKNGERINLYFLRINNNKASGVPKGKLFSGMGPGRNSATDNGVATKSPRQLNTKPDTSKDDTKFSRKDNSIQDEKIESAQHVIASSVSKETEVASNVTSPENIITSLENSESHQAENLFPLSSPKESETLYPNFDEIKGPESQPVKAENDSEIILDSPVLFSKRALESKSVLPKEEPLSTSLISMDIDSSIDNPFDKTETSSTILESSVNLPTDSLSSLNTPHDQSLILSTDFSPILKREEFHEKISGVNDDPFVNPGLQPEPSSVLNQALGEDTSLLSEAHNMPLESERSPTALLDPGSPADERSGDGEEPKNKILLKLPFLKPLEGEDALEEAKIVITESDSSPVLSRAKLRGLTKEQLRELKLARREADCQLNYGEEESPTPEYTPNMGGEGPFIIGNYITRHALNRISLAENRKLSINTQNSNDESPTWSRLNKKDMSRRAFLEKNHTKHGARKSFVTGMTVFALDRWGVWCEALITKADHKRVLIKYVDENINRQEWISLNHNRLKTLSDMDKGSPTLDVECDSPPVEITEMLPLEPPPELPPKVFIPEEMCSKCELPFQEFRYFCLHCPPSDGYICSRCYFHRFPKAHKHSRLVFAKERILSHDTIKLYKSSERALTRFEEDKMYMHQPATMQERWGSSISSLKVQRATILGVHRHHPGVNSSYKPTLIICAFCHDTQYSNSILTGNFISIDCPFILAPTSQELERRERKPLLGRIDHVDLFWCHINCARFSYMAQVMPKYSISSQNAIEANTFYNLGRALRLSNRNSCPRCREKGASIGCSKPGCHRYYHLKCTGKPLAFFERGQVFFCRTHETALRKLPPYTDVIGSISCQCCGGLLPKGRDTLSSLSSILRRPSSSSNVPTVLGSPNANTEASVFEGKVPPQIRTAFSDISNPNIPDLDIPGTANSGHVPFSPQEPSFVLDDPTINRNVTVSGDEEKEVDIMGDDENAKPNQTWSWYTCQKCIDEDGFYPFDLCQRCFTTGMETLGHEHPKEGFRWTNYHDAANDLCRSIFLFDPQRPWSKRPSVYEKKKLHVALSKAAKGLKRKHEGAVKPKTIKRIHCSQCRTTESEVWRKGYSGVLMCMSCFEGVSDQQEEPLPKKTKKTPEKIKITISLKAIDEAHGAPPQLDQAFNPASINDEGDMDLAFQYRGCADDYSHLPYHTRENYIKANQEDVPIQTRMLESYAPTESHWFSLLVLSSYYDIPGRAPRWASHSGSDYHGTWLPQTVRRAILRYTRPEERVLSNFLGRGTDAIESFLLKRKCVGVDINPVAVSLSQRNCSFAIPEGLGLTPVHRPVILQGDSRNLNDPILFCNESFDHVLSHPPYKDCVSYSTNIDGDLSKFPDQEEFTHEMSKVIRENWRLLKMGARVTLGIGDNREKCFYVPVSFQLLRNYFDNGFELEEIIIKRQRQCQMYGLGTYLSAHYGFLIFTHEYIFTLKKVQLNRKPPVPLRPFLRPPEEVILWKKAVRIRRRRRAMPNYPIERKSVIMGTVWSFRPQAPHTFEMLCKSRMVERFGKNGSNWEEFIFSFPKHQDEISDVKAPQEMIYSDGGNDFISPYERMREQRIKENNQKLLSLGLTAELGDERSEDISHHTRMLNLSSNSKGGTGIIIVPHIPNHLIVNGIIPYYRKAIREVTENACKRLSPEGFLIVGVQEYRFQDLQGSGRLVPLSLLVFEDIERHLKNSYPSPPLRLKELVICVPDGYQCNRSKVINSLPIEPCILDVSPNDPYPNLPLVHATYLIYTKL